VYTVSDLTSVLAPSTSLLPSPRSVVSSPAPRNVLDSITPISTPRTPPISHRPGWGTTGYLGVTNHSAVLQETRDNLSLLGAALQADDMDEEAYIPDARKVLSPGMREVCLTVLRFLPLREKASIRRPRDSYVFRSYMDRIAEIIMESVYATWDQHLIQGSSDASKLEQMAQALCINTSKPFSNDIRAPKAWMDQFIGPNLRWESLGKPVSNISHQFHLRVKG
jgi:hypothetical protein